MKKKRYQIKMPRHWSLLALFCASSAHALLTNPGQGTVVSTTETVEYTAVVNANSVNNLNINNSAAGQTYTINVRSGGGMTNSTILRDIMNITGSQSCNVLVTIFSGGQIQHNSTTKELLDDDGTGTGTVRLTVNAGGTAVGRFNGSFSRTASEIINAGSYNGSNFTLTLINNSGTMNGSNSGVTTVTNTGIMNASVELNASGTVTNSNVMGNITMGGNGSIANTGSIGTVQFGVNDILNNNGSATITGDLYGTTGAQLRIGPTTTNNLTLNGYVYFVPTITLFNSSSLTVGSSGYVQQFTSLSGAGRPVTINAGGQLEINVANSLAITGALTNSGTLRVNNTFNPTIYSSFTNPGGTVEVNDVGTITGNISATGASTFRVGTFLTTNFSTQGTITNFQTVTVHNNNSNMNVGHLISGVTNSFNVNSGCSATLSVAPTGTGAFNNAGTVTTAVANAIGLTGVFTNSGTLHVNNALSTTTFTTPTNTSTGIININNVTFTTNASFTNNGTMNVNNSSGAISGALVGGTGSTLNIGPVTSKSFAASSTINGIDNINVVQGSFSSAFTVTNVNNLFSVSSGQNATITNTLSGTGNVQNAGTFTLGTNGSLGSFAGVTNSGTFLVTGSSTNTTPITNNATMTISSTLAGAGSIHNDTGGTLTFSSGTINSNSVQNDNIFNISGSSTNNASITNNAQMTLSATLIGSGSINNSITGTLTFTGGASNNHAVTNNHIFQINGSTSNSAVLTNNDQMTVSSTLSGTGSIQNTSTGTLTFASGTNSNHAVTNNHIFQVTGSSSNSAILTNNAQMNVNNTLSGGGSIQNTSTGTLTFSGANSNNTVTNNNIFNVSGSSTNTAAITNNSQMTINTTLAGNGSITNTNGANLALQSGTSLGNSITNNSGGAINVSGNITSTNNITNQGSLSISGNISMAGQTLSTSGANSSVTVNGQRTIQAASFTDSGTYNTTISSVSTYDKLSITGNANLNGATVNVAAPASLSGTWPILTTTGTVSASGATFNLPGSSGLFSNWNAQVTSNAIQIVSGSTSFVDLATGTVNQEIAEVLDEMAMNITNPGQQILIDALYDSTTQEEFNNALQQLRPNTNSTTPIVAMQSAIFNKIENRIASLQNGYPTGATGIITGDFSPNTALWVGGFGSFGKQKAYGENFGYRATSFGSIVGFDTRLENDGILGAGVALSKTIVHEYINPNCTTGIVGYHGLIYGTHLMQDSTFFEWLATGAFTSNDGSRAIDINGTIMSTTSNYHTGQGAARVNYGVDVGFDDIFTLSPLTTMQYVFVYEPNYDEAYTPAALHVSPTHYQDIFTVGAGARISFPCDDWWLLGLRELRAIGTYDIVTSKNIVVSNFLVGSSTFLITNPAVARWAFKTGFDFAFKLSEHAMIQFSYDFEIRNRYTDQSASCKLKWLF